MGSEVGNLKRRAVITSAIVSVGSGHTTVTTSGTRVVLASSKTVEAVIIKALLANTGKIYIGDVTVASSNGFELNAGDTVALDVTNLNLIYIDSSVNGEGVSYIWEV